MIQLQDRFAFESGYYPLRHTRQRLTNYGAVLTILVLALGGEACVPRYNSPLPSVTPADLAAADRFPVVGDNQSLQAINETYARADAKCTKIQGAMQREADGIETRNLAIGASFAAAAAGLAAASGIYTLAEGDDADPTVSAVLALGSGASTAPTFFYFGSDDRATTVTERITRIEERRKGANDAWRGVKVAQTAVTLANQGAIPAEIQAALSRAWQAIDSLDDAVRELTLACR